MNALEQRVLSVVETTAQSFILTKLTGDETDRLKEAKREEREAKAKALARAASREKQTSTRESTDPDAIAELRAEEDCPVCSKILDQIEMMDDPARTKAIAQYGEFRVAIEDSEDAAVETLERNPELKEAVEGLSGVQM